MIIVTTTTTVITRNAVKVSSVIYLILIDRFRPRQNEDNQCLSSRLTAIKNPPMMANVATNASAPLTHDSMI